MRTTIDLNQDWLYLPENVAEAKNPGFSERECREVCIPHANLEVPWHNFDEKDYQFISWYRRHLQVPKKWAGKRLHIEFGAVMMAAAVYVNGKLAVRHRGGYTPFTVDITDLVEHGADNLIAVQVDSRERKDIPPCGGSIDYLTYGGIYRDVQLHVLEPVYIADVFARPKGKSVEAAITLASEHDYARETEVTLKLGSQKKTETVIVPPGECMTVDIKLTGLKVKKWTLEDPTLYTLETTLANGDTVKTRIGFREAEFRKDGFHLNGKRIKLMGLDRHQTYPYVGNAVPARVQARDADILKYELGLNVVRTSHYPQSPHFLNRCDEIGLLVFEEIPGWTHIGDEKWKAQSKKDVRDMIMRDRNHPSIVLWGVRINESLDDHDFYADTNWIARECDPTRQTGGVRNFRESEFLEDVFTYNDFSNGVQKPNHAPYLISEFNGHMFPAKPFDCEERLVEHALRHARIQNAQMGTKGMSGAIGWCAFDYCTHAEFGSGDRVCYHGVMDMFRFPKFAAWVYKSQRDRRYGYVLEPATHFKWGERSVGGWNPLYVFSNCDTVEIHVDGKRMGTYKPARKEFPNLPYPPFRCEGFMKWGQVAKDAEFVGKVKGKAVIRRKIAGDGVPQKLWLVTDDKQLAADGADMTRIAFAVTDRHGNILPYATGAVTLEIAGPGELVGENPFALVAGRGALWLRAGRKKGTVKITASASRLKPQSITVKVG